jgi:hypothetical protein
MLEFEAMRGYIFWPCPEWQECNGMSWCWDLTGPLIWCGVASWEPGVMVVLSQKRHGLSPPDSP